MRWNLVSGYGVFAMPYQITACGLSDVGSVRQRNEDVWREVPEHHLYVLADGMGGHRAGDVAAREAVDSLCHILPEKLAQHNLEKDSLTSVRSSMRLAMEEVNRIVYMMAKADDGLRGMGTTLCCVLCWDQKLIYGHVGDSRIYRLRKGELEQLTDDHSLYQELKSKGALPSVEKEEFTYKNIITKAVGTEPVVEPSVGMDELLMGDLLLICSDGLTDMVSEEEMMKVMSQSKDIQECASGLIQAALNHGGLDNITVVLISVSAL